MENLEGLNVLAKEDKEKFVKTLQKESEKQAEIERKRIGQVEEILSKLNKEAEKAEKYNRSLDAIDAENKNLKDKLVQSESKQRSYEQELNKLKKQEQKKKLNEFFEKKLNNWRRKSWLEFGVSILVFLIPIFYFLIINKWDLNETSNELIALNSNIIVSSIISLIGLFFSGVVIKTLYNKYRNHSNINAFKSSIEIPDDIKS